MSAPTPTKAKLISGKPIADSMLEAVAQKVAKLAEKPTLAVIIAEGDPASELYVSKKQAACRKVGVHSLRFDIPRTETTAKLLALIHKLNADPKVDGILVQLPLPKQIDEDKVIEAIDPQKDVDGFHPINLGRLSRGDEDAALISATPKGIIKLLESIGCDVSGKVCTVVGTSNIVGKPVAYLLMNRKATVITANSRTPDLGAVTRQADVLVVGVGKPGLVRGDMVKPGATVIDVGTSKLANGKLAGDVDFESASQVASAITPVPGGVGPMTIASLLDNTLVAYGRRRKK
ncbi:MAG: bifunctional 5,10-methylenetetrahydrofolate dehydrogenase/5,10-methenyltetrahydrofolate cyclohydrolase [Candidatus Micrarchaeia archaeon]|jgi:methylenetetrahydrofolate dehydrogenase (NADP+)/methenyltetrahydrofolate cyclohydrolase